RLRLIGDRIERVAAQGKIERVRDVEAIDVPVARPAEIGDVEPVRLEHADRIGAHQKAVLVKLEAGVVVVGGGAELRRVTGKDEVLDVIIRDDEVLVAVVERIQLAVGVLFEWAEIDEVELLTVGVAVAEQAHAAVDVAENEAAKVAGERLTANAQ